MVPPAVTVAGPLLVSERSAEAPTSVSTLSSLLVGSGSDVVASMLALLVIVAWLSWCSNDDGDGCRRSGGPGGAVAGDRDAGVVVAGPAAVARVDRDERDTGGQRVGDADILRRRRTGVRDVEVVTDGPPGSNCGRPALGDREVSRARDGGANRVVVVRRSQGRPLWSQCRRCSSEWSAG